MNKYSYCATMIAAILSTTTMANASSLAISVANDDAGIFQPSLNALYGHPAADRGDYTAGLFLGYSHDLTDASQLSFHIAQDIYSPSGANKRKPEAVKGDRAFSAFLHTGLEWNSLATNWLRYRLGTDIGVIGPDAGGQEVQNRAHRIIGAEKYPAWQDQIENRYGYTAKGMVSLTPAIDILGVNVGFYPEVSAVGGNLFQYLGYGATVALGNDKTFNSDNGFGLLSRRGLIHTQKEGLIYKVFAGVERREVDK
ncbi:DUF2219 family protein, partial [Salmonella enterica subsp. enterica serovar Infantis]|nr:DUF2219 family protein [Salmonella enterica subsp. enterica serovar Infantis]